MTRTGLTTKKYLVSPMTRTGQEGSKIQTGQACRRPERARCAEDLNRPDGPEDPNRLGGPEDPNGPEDSDGLGWVDLMTQTSPSRQLVRTESCWL